MTKSDEIWNKRFHNNKSSILHVYMPIMPLVLATPCDLSFTVKSIEVGLLLRGGNFHHHHKVNSIIDSQNIPFFLVCEPNVVQLSGTPFGDFII